MTQNARIYSLWQLIKRKSSTLLNVFSTNSSCKYILCLRITMNDLFLKGGTIVWILSLFSVYGLGIVAERLFYYHRVRINSGDMLRGLSALVRRGSYAEALHEASRAPGPVARVIESALCRPSSSRAELSMIVQEAAQLEVFRVEKNVRGLLAVATVAPLLGILGTLISLMKFYHQIDFADGRASGTMLSQAVFEALITSAMGLAVAIPAYLFYMFLSARARLVLNEIERAGIETINILHDAKKQLEEEPKFIVKKTPHL